MLTITAVSANAVDYLLRGSGCSEHEHAETAGQRMDGAGYMLAGAAKEPAGVWYGTGLEELLGIEVGTTATAEQVKAVLGRLEHPSAVDENGDPMALGRRPFKFKSREEREKAALAAEPDATKERQDEIKAKVRGSERKAVAYYDLTFSPVKSMSVYWATLQAQGRTDEAANVVAAHRAGIAAAMAYVEVEAGFVRSGYHGKTASGRSVGVYEKGNGLAWIRWDHSTNRDQQPQLHAHVTALNRVTTSSDGVVRALDGKGFRPIKQAADAIYRATYERELQRTNKVVFAVREDGKAREIMGYDQRLLGKASSRRREIAARVQTASAAFEQAHGRSPSPAERKQIDRIAWRETRQAKNYRTSPGEQLRRWVAPLRAELDRALVAAEKAAEKVARHGHPDQRGYADRSREQLLRDAIASVQQKFSTWEVGNLVDAIKSELERTPLTAKPGEELPVVLANEVLRNGAVYGVNLLTAPDPGPVPEALQREDGKSRYRPHNLERWATSDQLSTEAQIVARAREIGAPAVAGPVLEMVRIEAERAGLSEDQRDAVLGILSSGRRGDVLIGPAGAGKSRTVAALAGMWESHIGGRVLGVATSQIATQVLAEDGLTAINTTVFTHRFTPDDQGQVQDRIHPGDMVVIDEAGMSGTPELKAISTLVAAGGGKLVYTGDHEQLASVEAGGMLELLVRDAGAYELSEIHRFHHAWERDASVRLRAGDPEVVGVYAEHGRIRGGTKEEMASAAVRGYLADTLDGHTSLLVVRDNESAAALSARIRGELVAAGKVAPEVLGETRDGNLIGAGDLLQARQNDRGLRVDGAGMVTNREVYTVLDRNPFDGTMRVEDKDGLVAHLPPEYVSRHTTLAYAVTTYASQGLNRWSSHSLIDDKTSRSGAYVPGTRGREANTFYVICQQEPDHHTPERLDRDAADVLVDVLTRPIEGRVAAELARREGAEEGRSLAWVGTQWDLLTSEYGRDRYTDTLAQLLGDQRMDAVFAEPGYDRLMARVRGTELSGHDPAAVLAEAVTRGGLDGANSVSDVLRYRIGLGEDGRRPEREVRAGDWTSLTADMTGPVGDYAHLLAQAATTRQHELGERAAADPPAWALAAQLLGPVPDQPQQHAEWVRRAGTVAAYRDLHAVPDTQLSLGPAPDRNRPFHHALWQQAAAALGHPADALDYATATTEQLRQMRQTWQTAQTWAPEYVSDQLAAAREQAADYRRDTIIWAAGQDQHHPDSPARPAADTDLAAAQRLAARAAARVEALEDIHAVRQDWYTRHADEREQARYAGDELERRGLHRDTAAPARPQPEQSVLLDIAEPEHAEQEHTGQGRDQHDRHPHRPAPQRRAELAGIVEAGYQTEREATAAADEHARVQPGLFELAPTAAQEAGAEPLRPAELAASSTTTDPTGEPAGQDPALTVRNAARNAAIITALRAATSNAREHAASDPTRGPAPECGRDGDREDYGVGVPPLTDQHEQNPAGQQARHGHGLHR